MKNKDIKVIFMMILITIIESAKTLYFLTVQINNGIFKPFIINNICIDLLILLIFFIIIYNYRKNYLKFEKFDLYRHIDFKNVSPLYAGEILNIKTLPLNKILIIIYGLIDQKIINVRYDNEKTYIRLNKNIDLETINKLKYYESALIKIIFNSSTDFSEYELSEIISCIKKDKQKLLYIETILNELKSEMDLKYYQSFIDYLDTLPKFLNYIIGCEIVLTIIPMLPIIALIIKYEIYYALLVYVPWIFIIILCFSIKFVRKQYILEINKLRGLYNFLIDFSNFKNLGIKYIEIYEEYYLYALSFNLTSKVIKQYDINNLLSGHSSNRKYLYIDIKEDEKDE